MDITLHLGSEGDQTIHRLQTIIGLSDKDAESLFKAALHGALDHTVERIGGSSPVPTSMVAARAEELHFICLQANRILRQREVEVLFRTTPSNAKSVLTMMRATYEETLNEQFAQRMRNAVEVRKTGTNEDGLTYTFHFSETSALESALAMLRREGLDKEIDDDRQKKTLVVRREVPRNGKTLEPLKILGLDKPA